MPYIGKQPATISAVSVDTDTGTFSGQVAAASLDISGNVDVDGVLETDGLSIASTVITASAADINLIDGITNGTVIASKAIITDANKDISGGRNITISGELDAATLDISGNADIDGTLEADAITVNGTALNTVIAGVTVANATLAATTTVTDSTANTNFPVVFHDESNALLDDTGALRYNPSTGELLVPKLTVAGVTTTADTVTMQAANAVVFEGATADAHETTLTITDPTADRTITLPNVSGTLPILAADSNTAITSTPAELNILDGATVVVGEINALDLGSTAVGTAIASKAVILDSNKDYTGIRNFTISGELDAGSLDISGDIDVDGTTNLDVVDIDGAVDMASTLAVSGAISSSTGFSVGNLAVLGQEIDVSSGDFLLDVAGNITLDAGGGNIILQEDGVSFGELTDNSGGNFDIKCPTNNADIRFKGVDGGSNVTALRLDMSDAGTAVFNHNIKAQTDDGFLSSGASDDLIIFHDGTDSHIFNSTGDMIINSAASDKDLIFKGNDGGSVITALTLDMSDAGTAIFNHDISLADNGRANFGNSADFQIYHDSNDAYFRNELSNSNIIIQGNDGGTQVEIARFDAGNRGFAVGYNQTGLHTMVVGGATGGNATFKAGNTSTSGNTTCILAFMDGSGSASVNSAFLQGFNGANNFYLLGNGTHTFTSDENAKKNIETTRDGYLEDLAKLRVVKYNWKEQDDSEDKELGLIAQEVEKVFPKLVMKDIDPQIEDADKKKMIKTTVLPFMLLKALQEANTKITALEARIVTLEGA